MVDPGPQNKPKSASDSRRLYVMIGLIALACACKLIASRMIFVFIEHESGSTWSVPDEDAQGNEELVNYLVRRDLLRGLAYVPSLVIVLVMLRLCRRGPRVARLLSLAA